MLQVKSFKISDDVGANEWLKNNYKKVLMGKDGPEVKVFGANDPHIAILYDLNGVGSEEYQKEALEMELRLCEQQLFEYQRQYLDNEAKRNMFPEYELRKGKHELKHTAGWEAHNNDMIKDRQQIKLQRAKIMMVERLLANPSSINGEENKEPATQPGYSKLPRNGNDKLAPSAS